METKTPNSNLIVTKKAQRPAGKNGFCFYCGRPIGKIHKINCVFIKKMVRARLTIECDIEVPSHWSRADVEHFYNHGTWCANNVLDVLKCAIDEKEASAGCLCGSTNIKCLGDSSYLYLAK